MKHLLSDILRCSLLTALLTPLAPGLQTKHINAHTRPEGISAFEADHAPIDSTSHRRQEQAESTPPPPPEPIDPNTEAAREKPPKEGYFYYYDGKPVPLTTVPDKIALHFTDTGLRLQKAEAVLKDQSLQLGSVDRRGVGEGGLVVARLKPGRGAEDVERVLRELRLKPEIRSASPLFEWGSLQLTATDEVIAQFLRDARWLEIEQFLSQNDLEVTGREHLWDTTWLLRVARDDPRGALEIANTLHESDLVIYAEPNFAVRKDKKQEVNSGSTLASELQGWNIDKVNAPEAWGLLSGYPAHSVRVAVVDDGVERSHEDLWYNMFAYGYDALTRMEGLNAGRPKSDSSEVAHGTWVAGVSSMVPDNGLGGIGVASDFVSIVPVSICDAYGDSNCEVAARGIRWAADHAEVINLSWRIGLCGAVAGAIEYAVVDKGRVVVAASGGTAANTVDFPGYLQSVIAVGGTTQDDRWKNCLVNCRGPWEDLGDWGSNYGSGLDLVAPGARIYTTDLMGSAGWPLVDYKTLGGTSFAAPHVAAAAAMMLVANPDLTPSQIQDILQRTADEVHAGDPYSYGERRQEGGWNEKMGFGRLNAEEAVKAVLYPPKVRLKAGAEITDRAQLVVTWRDDYRHVLYHNNDISISNGVSAGYLPLDGVGPGCYDFYLKTRHSLRRKQQFCVDVEGVHWIDFTDNGASPLSLGDANGDNEVNNVDFSIWLHELDSTGPELLADFNTDGVVSVVDFSIWRHNHFDRDPKGDGWAGPSLPESAIQTSTVDDARLATSSAGSVVLATDQTTIEVGDVLTLPIVLDTASEQTDGASVLIHYDPGVFRVHDSDSQVEGVQVSPGSLYTDIENNSVLPDQGLVRFGAYSPGDEMFQGTGQLFTVTLEATAAISQTEIKVKYDPDWSIDSHSIKAQEVGDILRYVEHADFQISGSPVRQMPLVSISPSSIVNETRVIVDVGADDPYDQVEWVQVQAWYNNDWHYLGTDGEKMDGWSVEWDTTAIEDQIVYLWAYAGLPGGKGGSTMTGGITLDRTPPEYVGNAFTPSSPSMADFVILNATASDGLAGVRKIEVYVNDATDGSPDGTWMKIGEILGSSGSIYWDTTPFDLGLHQVAFAIEDEAGNWNRWQDGPAIHYDLRYWADLNYDCSVGIADIQAAADHWRCGAGDACYDERYDLDGDGAVSVIDIVRIASEWGWSCP